MATIYEIYTDGATSGNGMKTAKGGWAFVCLENEQDFYHDSGFIANTTNNICELTAIINACKYIERNGARPFEVTIYSDSAYCINCYKLKWYKKWLANGWVNSSKESVKNRELWEQLIPYFEDSSFKFEKVKGHSTSKWNNMVDELAKGKKNG